MRHAERICGGKLHAGGRDHQVVGFILSQLLDGETWSGSVNREVHLVDRGLAP
jgi:hypothetical protein